MFEAWAAFRRINRQGLLVWNVAAASILSKKLKSREPVKQHELTGKNLESHLLDGRPRRHVCTWVRKKRRPPIYCHFFLCFFRYVFWYHNDRMINYDSERGISVTTTPGRKTHSQLSIQRADVSDSGNYTCAPSSSLPATIQVFVSGMLYLFNIYFLNGWKVE
jgi:hypothetical protein